MSDATRRMDVWGRPLLAASGAVALLVLALYVQHVRHGWPFSLHHGLPPISPEPRQSASAAASHEAEHGAPIAGAERAAVEIPSERLEALGVTFEPARVEDIGGELRAVATIVPDESRIAHVHTRVSGWIERLQVRTTGESVRAGQALASIFSRELLASQTEYLSALRAPHSSASAALTSGARQRLLVLGMTDAEIAALERRGEPLHDVVVSSPRAGAILHRGVTVGAAVDPSTELFTIADLSVVWAIAEVPEANIPDVHIGMHATLDVPGAGIAAQDATVAFLYPTLTERTRTLRIRFELDNASGSLRPGEFGTATLAIDPRSVLTVPRDAVVDTGVHQHVFVREGARISPRQVTLGARMGERVEIRSGLEAGEVVAASGVFILDSESRLRASGGEGMGHHHGDHAASPLPDQHGATGAPTHAPPSHAHGTHAPPTLAPSAVAPSSTHDSMEGMDMSGSP